jgi:hypothetical protein
MRVVFRLVFTLVVFLAALPFILLSAMGHMKPAEGFCLEHGMAQGERGDPPTAGEQANSYFISPELGHRSMAIIEHVNWPVCIRSRRGEHRAFAWRGDHHLRRLREPNLSRLHVTDRSARTFRVLTDASFSPLAIAFRVEQDPSGGGVLYAAWQGHDSKPRPRAESGNPVAAQQAVDAWATALPRRESTRRLSETDVDTLWRLMHQAMPRESVTIIALDGNWLLLEAVEEGKRKVDFVWLDPPPDPTGRLVCALAEKSGIPSRALEQGLVWNPCDPVSANEGYSL